MQQRGIDLLRARDRKDAGDMAEAAAACAFKLGHLQGRQIIPGPRRFMRELHATLFHQPLLEASAHRDVGLGFLWLTILQQLSSPQLDAALHNEGFNVENLVVLLGVDDFEEDTVPVLILFITLLPPFEL